MVPQPVTTPSPAIGLSRHAEIDGPVGDVHVVFLEGALVEQHLDALARRQLALAVLGVDALLAAAEPCLAAALFELFKDVAHEGSHWCRIDTHTGLHGFAEPLIGRKCGIINLQTETCEIANMALGKLFIGLKVRELRVASQQTQSQFAKRIGISTSYLNQIENNQRSVSAAVLLQLADKFNLDISELSRGETDRLLSALSEALADPIFESFSPSLQELKLISQNAPALAHALVLAHQAYRRKSEQLASLDHDRENAPGLGATPYEEVRDFFHFVDNYVHTLDVLAETLAAGLYGMRASTAGPPSCAILEQQHGVLGRARGDQ
jgi:transcriptional regulator with XRE-family HTH domain